MSTVSATATESKPSPVHNIHGYLKYGCRCATCKRANTDRGNRQRADRTARGLLDPTLIPHGTPGGYSNWGCRCEPCTKANTDYCRDRKYARRERAANNGSVAVP